MTERPPGIYRTYVPRKFYGTRREIIDRCNVIIGQYQAQGYNLTLRQLYYRMVAANVIPNNEASYNNLSDTLSKARLAGLVSWDAMEDRTRFLRGVGYHDSPDQVIASAASGYNIDMWQNQDHRIEVWVEKDALVDVVSRASNALEVPYFSCRGYVSQTEMWNAAMRLAGYAQRGQAPVILHLGDHDPSGKHMTRDIIGRLEMFMGGVPIERLALNMDQIRQYNPPPNPAKPTDSRYPKYVDEFGPECWELDALEPSVINQLIVDAIEARRDKALWAEMESKREAERAPIREIAENWETIGALASRALDDDNEWDRLRWYVEYGELPREPAEVPPLPVEPRAIPLVPGAGIVW